MLPHGKEFEWSLEGIGQNFQLSVAAYRELLLHARDAIPTLLEKEQAERLKKRFKGRIEGLSRAERSRISSFLDELFGKPPHLDAGSTSESQAGSDDVDSEGLSELDIDWFLDGLSERGVSVLMSILRSMHRQVWTNPEAQRERLYRAIIIGLVAQFEVLVGDLAGAFYRANPGALDADAKVLSLGDLQEIGSVEGAIDRVIETKTDSLLNGSLDDWAKFFDSRMSIDLKELVDDWNRVVEIVQRRHILVHAGGRISRRYLHRVDASLVQELHPQGGPGGGTRLESEYLATALNRIEVLGTLLAFNVWVRLERDDLGRFESALQEWLYGRLLEERWTVALPVAQTGIDSERLTKESQLVCRFSYWLCLKKLDRFEEVADEVEAMDVSALSSRYRLKKLALLDRDEEFFSLLESTEGKDLDHDAWTEWPVFSRLRDQDRFKELEERFSSND